MRTGDDSRTGVGGVGLRGTRGGSGIVGASYSSSCFGSRGRVGSPGMGTPPAFGLLEISIAGGDESAACVLEMLGAPIGAAPLKRSRMALTPPAGDIVASS